MQYSISYHVTKASGTITYTVEADTPEEASKKLKNGEGFISFYEIEPHYDDVDYEKDIYEDPDAEAIDF